jgi:metal-responsive CopG/Arc/MetJ family transcriptional regulator
MKTAISIPDPVFERAERLAARLHKSRSQLFTDAVSEYLARHEPETVSRRLDDVLARVGVEEDRFPEAAATEVLKEVEW